MASFRTATLVSSLTSPHTVMSLTFIAGASITLEFDERDLEEYFRSIAEQR